MVLGYKYEEFIISFFDIIGFKDMCGSGKESAEALEEKCCSVVTQLSVLQAGLESLSQNGKIITQQFADSAIRMRRYHENTLYSDLIDEVHVVAQIQSAFSASHRCWLRGAIVVGKACFDDVSRRFCFGPGINRAHKIESTESNVSRIVLDGGSISSERLLELGAYVCRDEDGQLMFDYLRYCADFKNLLGDHKRHFEIREKEIDPEDLKLVNRYEWLKRYHNKSVNRYFDGAVEVLID